MTLLIFIFIQEEHTTHITEVGSLKKLDHLIKVIVFFTNHKYSAIDN